LECIVVSVLLIRMVMLFPYQAKLSGVDLREAFLILRPEPSTDAAPGDLGRLDEAGPALRR